MTEDTLVRETVGEIFSIIYNRVLDQVGYQIAAEEQDLYKVKRSTYLIKLKRKREEEIKSRLNKATEESFGITKFTKEDPEIEEKEIIVADFQTDNSKDICVSKLYEITKQKEMQVTKKECKINNLKLVHQLNLKKNSNEFSLFLINEVLKKDIDICITERSINPKNEAIIIQSLNAGLHEELQYSVVLKETPTLTFDKLKANLGFQKMIVQEFKGRLSKELKIPEKSIHILGLTRGSVGINFRLKDSLLNPKTVSKALGDCYGNKLADLSIKPVLSYCRLSYESLDPDGNRDFTNWKIDKDKRGGMAYYPPKGWQGIGLKVSQMYDKGKDEWLAMDGNPNEWAVAYHGLSAPKVAGPIANWQAKKGSVTQEGLKGGGRQLYSNEIDTRNGGICGVGVYCGNHVEVAEAYAEKVTVNDNKYQIVFQCRVKPNSVKVPKKKSSVPGKWGADWENDYIIIKETKDIRPYRILIKKE